MNLSELINFYPPEIILKPWFYNDIRGNRNYLIRLYSLNIRSKIWRQFLVHDEVNPEKGFHLGTFLRSSHPEVFCKRVVLKNFTKFTGKHLGQSLLFNNVAGLRSATLLKRRLWHRCFLVNFVKILRTPFLTEHLRWLLLLLVYWQTFHFRLKEMQKKSEKFSLIQFCR